MSDSASPVGVIVARFQVPELHAGHRWFIEQVAARHRDVFIVLGMRKGVRTKRDPLTYEEREAMVLETFPTLPLTIRPLPDNPISHQLWTEDLDALVRATFPGREAVLYGSRGSFLPYYSGAFATEELAPIHHVSGTEAREALTFPHTRDARAAIIHEMHNRRPVMIATSDVAIICPQTDRVLLIAKHAHRGYLSFVGGHAEKQDEHGHTVAAREGAEEVRGVTLGTPQYIDTLSIDDPRYRDAPDGIMTSFYWARHEGGEPSPGDDADAVHWIHKDALLSRLVPWHKPLGEKLLANWPN